jgi:hypothetical protein
MPREIVRRLAAAGQRRLGAASRPQLDKPSGPRPFADMGGTLKLASAALRGAGVPHALTGAPACWVFGASDTGIDWDMVIPPDHVDTAATALHDAGLRVERPPEGWLLKAWDGDVLVDVIFDPLGPPVEECLTRATTERVLGLPMRVLDPTDVVTSMLLARSELFLAYERLLQIVRPIREHIDWGAVRRGTAASPYAAGFLALVEALGVAPSPAGGEVLTLPGVDRTGMAAEVPGELPERTRGM